MDPEALEAKLRAREGLDLDARMEALGAAYGGLLDREALLLLVADEHDMLPRQAALERFGAGADDFGADKEAAGVLTRLDATRPFRRKDGSTGFVANAEVTLPAADGKPEEAVRVVLWDEAVRLAQPWPGKAVRINALMEKQGRDGARELHTTRATRVEAA